MKKKTACILEIPFPFFGDVRMIAKNPGFYGTIIQIEKQPAMVLVDRLLWGSCIIKSIPPCRSQNVATDFGKTFALKTRRIWNVVDNGWSDNDEHPSCGCCCCCCCLRHLFSNFTIKFFRKGTSCGGSHPSSAYGWVGCDLSRVVSRKKKTEMIPPKLPSRSIQEYCFLCLWGLSL